MIWKRQFGSRARWLWGVIVSLLLLFVCWPAHGHAARASQTQQTWQVASEGWARVTVVRGRLSVDLRDADIQTVLAQIAEQAGFTLLTGPLERQTVSVQFADVPLEQGVRRLLRLASLNHVMLSAPNAAGRVALKELRVFAGGDTRSPFVAAAVQAQQPEATPATQTDPGQAYRKYRVQQEQQEQQEQNPIQDLVRRLQGLQKAQPPSSE